jgi:hypothetical protein
MHDDFARQAARTTIVGGQPPAEQRPLVQIPVGLERLLGMAAVDPRFCEALILDWRQATAAAGFELTGAERQILEAIGDAQLQQMASQMDQRLVDEQRRSFLSQAGAALVVLAGGATVAASAAGCRTSRYIPPRPGTPPHKPTPATQPAATQPATRPTLKPGPIAGVRPPTPRPRPSKPTSPPPKNRGIRPDRPNRPTLAPDPEGD